MTETSAVSESRAEVPAQALTGPALLYLYYKIEQTLGIKAGNDSLVKLNEYIEKNCEGSFIENPAAFEDFLSCEENIFCISSLLTVNETYFFREGVHFELLESILPELIKTGRHLRICSAAVSIGCEAYSIAMFLDHYAKKGAELYFTIDAFDVSAQAIETAKSARYTANTIRADGAKWKHILDSYLTSDNGEYLVSKNIREKVNFFTHNIMNPLEKQYDIIFFRNSLIYFSPRSRFSVMNNICDSLFADGFLFLGISETASVNHPLLADRHLSNAFYFQKTGTTSLPHRIELKPETSLFEKKVKSAPPEKQVIPKNTEFPITCAEIAYLLKIDEGKENAQNVLETIKGKGSSSFSGGSLAAGALYFLHTRDFEQDFDKANQILIFLEKHNTGAFTRFLRGEYFFLLGMGDDAEKFYQESAVKNKYFWPAFYRIAVLSAEGNRTRFEYKAKKAIESIELWQNIEKAKEQNYECFIGGFSPDYFRRILEKKLSE